MADFPSIEPDLEEIALIANNQVYNSPLTGQAQTASLTGAKWQCTPTFSNRNGKEARDLRAFLFNQEGVSGRFNYYPASVDNIGTHAGGGVVDGAGQTGKELVTKGWDADQVLLFSAGDYLTVNGEMKMVTADVAVAQDYIEYDETNYVQSPFDPEGWTSSPSANISNIVINNPSGEPYAGFVNSSSPSGALVISRVDVIPFLEGDDTFLSLLIKDVTSDYLIQFQMREDAISNTVAFNPDGSVNSNSAGLETNVADLNNGFKLIQVKRTILNDTLDADGIIYISGFGIGSQLYVQAAFFGKANDWPAKLRANATIPITPAIRVSPSDENAIDVENPYFPARLDTDDMSRLQVSAPVIYNTTLSIVEDF